MNTLRAFGVLMLALLVSFTVTIVLYVFGLDIEFARVDNFVDSGFLLIGWTLYFELKHKRQ